MRSQNSDQRRYFDDDQQRDKGQQYKRFLQSEQRKGEKRGNEKTGSSTRWPEESGSIKNSDTYREDEDKSRSGRGGQAGKDSRSGNEQRENQFRSGDQFNQGSEQQQRRMKRGFGGINRRSEFPDSGQQNSFGQQRYGSGSVGNYDQGYGNEPGYGGQTEYDQRNRGGTDMNQYDNRNARSEGNQDSRNRYGNNYGQGYYGESENQGWLQDNDYRNRNEQRNQGREDWNKGPANWNQGGDDWNSVRRDFNMRRGDTDRGREEWNQGRGDWNQGRGNWNQGRGEWNQGRGELNKGRGEWNQDSGDRNPNMRGSYGTGNYSNMPSRNQGGTDYNSTSRYYSRTRDNDPFI
jgi:23S rRNA pseudouridine2605 synthase